MAQITVGGLGQPTTKKGLGFRALGMGYLFGFHVISGGGCDSQIRSGT